MTILGWLVIDKVSSVLFFFSPETKKKARGDSKYIGEAAVRSKCRLGLGLALFRVEPSKHGNDFDLKGLANLTLLSFISFAHVSFSVASQSPDAAIKRSGPVSWM